MNRLPKILWQDVVSPRLRGFWSRISLSVSGLDSGAITYLVMFDAQGEALSDGLFLNPIGTMLQNAQTSCEILCFVSPVAAEIRVYAIGTTANKVEVGELNFNSVSRVSASVYLLYRAQPGDLLKLLKSIALKPHLVLRSIRQLLVTVYQELYRPPQDYASWIALFDTWSPDTLLATADHPSIAYFILARDLNSEALTATLQSLDAQYGAARYAILHTAVDLYTPHQRDSLGADYIGILQAGEVLPRHATVLAAEQLQRLSRPEIGIADEDEIDWDGRRHSPEFKPQPSHITMISGILSRGLWLVRHDVFAGYRPTDVLAAEAAEALRLDLWLTRQRVGAGQFSHRLPFILTHRRPDAETSSPTDLATVVEQHLRHGGPKITPIATYPLTFKLKKAGALLPSVTVIVPSTLRQPHSLSCIQAILQETEYEFLDLHVVVMQPGPLDAVQHAAAATLAQHSRARICHFVAPRFNFSAANNHVAAHTKSDYILLLNDDVSPILGDWLHWMVAFLQDPDVGIVGARLLYPDGRVQHGGVIMGLAGLCEHANRYLPGDETGYMGRAVLAQEMSVVTGACMLVRRSLYEEVGGLDVGYPSAFNDVDFALRVGETGHSIIYAPQAELYHHELQTYGSHYAGEREPFQQFEERRMRQRWAKVCADDPFHSPNLGLLPNREWELAFPPRVSRCRYLKMCPFEAEQKDCVCKAGCDQLMVHDRQQ